MYSRFVESLVTNPKNFSFLGFTIVRSVLNHDEVADFRKLIFENFKKSKNNRRILLPSQVLSMPEIYELPFRNKSVEALKLALGDYYVQFCDFNLRKNCFGGWHVDSGSESGADYLFDKDYKFAKCGIFFQENSSDYGGGIDFRLFSHKCLYNRLPKVIQSPLSKLYSFLKRALSHRVIIHPGDMVFFDSRLEHTSSLPKSVSLSDLEENGIYALEENNAKYVLYWNSCSEKFWETFMQNTFKRAILEEVLPGAKEAFVTDYASRVYPEEYPESLRMLVDKCNIQIASPTKRQAMIYKKLLSVVSE